MLGLTELSIGKRGDTEEEDNSLKMDDDDGSDANRWKVCSYSVVIAEEFMANVLW